MEPEIRIYYRALLFTLKSSKKAFLYNLESGIDVGQGINVGPGKLDKSNKCRALNKCKAWKI